MESDRIRAVISELEREYAALTEAIQRCGRFSPEAAGLANERSKVRLALNVHRVYLREALAREANND